MKTTQFLWSTALVMLLLQVGDYRILAQSGPEFTAPQSLTNREVKLRIHAPAGQMCRIEASQNLLQWAPLVTLVPGSNGQFTDSAGPFHSQRFYRAQTVTETNAITGDHISTSDGDVVIHPINHASFVMRWKGVTIYSDPVGGASRFQGLPRADLIVVTHSHSDHFDASTINSVKATNVTVLVPQAVFQSLSASLKSVATVLTNSAMTNLLGVQVEAVPAYNLTSSFHPVGTGNGYVLTIGGTRIYISGDTEDVPELRALPNIDVAFVCMNLPFTMSVDKAASAVREFKPRIIYPYHYSGSDVNKFKDLMRTEPDVEVRLRTWY